MAGLLGRAGPCTWPLALAEPAWYLAVSAQPLRAAAQEPGRAQVAGLTCDWLLMIVWGRLVYLGPRPVPAFAWFGLAAACLHMAEILPLVALLVGLVPTPWIPGGAPVVWT